MPLLVLGVWCARVHDYFWCGRVGQLVLYVTYRVEEREPWHVVIADNRVAMTRLEHQLSTGVGAELTLAAHYAESRLFANARASEARAQQLREVCVAIESARLSARERETLPPAAVEAA